MTKDQFFQVAQFSFFAHKVSKQNTNFRLFKHYDEHVMACIEKHFDTMDEKEVSSIFFLYGHNMWEAHYRFTHSRFLDGLFDKFAANHLTKNLSAETLSNIARSIGTMSYKTPAVIKILEVAREKVTKNKSLTGI